VKDADEYRSLLSSLFVADACASAAPADAPPPSESQALVYARDTVKSCRVHAIVSESKVGAGAGAKEEG
jgi:hypothetical protein